MLCTKEKSQGTAITTNGDYVCPVNIPTPHPHRLAFGFLEANVP